MAALKEIKGRIASVQSTLKITSAMKMVASAKLHRVQAQAQALARYEERLAAIAGALGGDPDLAVVSPLTAPHDKRERAVVAAFSSDGSLCGAFNANAARALAEQTERLKAEGFERITVIPVGEKIAQAARKAGYEIDERFRSLVGKASYESAAALADALMEEYASGSADRVLLVYNHFHSMGRQIVRQERYLPMAVPEAAENVPADRTVEYIYEPAAARLLEELLPYTLRTQLYSVLLDSRTAEHAARTVAMQTAADNAKELLDELSLTYNKRRQQAITDELADIAHPD